MAYNAPCVQQICLELFIHRYVYDCDAKRYGKNASYTELIQHMFRFNYRSADLHSRIMY